MLSGLEGRAFVVGGGVVVVVVVVLKVVLRRIGLLKDGLRPGLVGRGLLLAVTGAAVVVGLSSTH